MVIQIECIKGTQYLKKCCVACQSRGLFYQFHRRSGQVSYPKISIFCIHLKQNTLSLSNTIWRKGSLMYKPIYIALFLALISSANSTIWSASVVGDTDAWSIYRQSSNLSFICEQSVQGQISPVDYKGRTLSPYHSFYENVRQNDVGVKERTSALQGSYSSKELLSLESFTNDTVNAALYTSIGSGVFIFRINETWPVNLSYARSMDYSGKQINNQEYMVNNRDYVGANFLYNKEFSEERSLNMSLEMMNATIFIEKNSIDLAKVDFTKDTQYKLQSHSTGIADFKWAQVGAMDEILNAGEEQFVGDYDLVKTIRMKSRVDTILEEDEWLPCCSGGFISMNPVDQEPLRSAEGVFDCACPKD